jgi:hypothetical protein
VKPRPEPHTEYAAEGPTPEFRAASRREAVRCLAAAWDVSESRAADLLANPDEYREECRARQRLTGPEARRILERRYAGP